MNNPNHIFESLETIFWFKTLKSFDADPGWKNFGSRIRDKHPGSATLHLPRLYWYMEKGSNTINLN